MRRAILTALVLFASLSPAWTADQEADLRALVDRYCAAWGTLDPAKAEPLYAKDAGLVFFDLLPLKYEGWTEYDKGVRAVFATFESMKLVPKGDLKVTRRGNVAWTTTTMRLDVKPKTGEAMALDVRQTLVLEKRSGEWRIVHEHFSAPLPDHE